MSNTQARLDAAKLQDRIAALLPSPRPYSASVQAYAGEAVIVDGPALDALAAELERVTAAAREAGEAADFFGAFTTPDAVTVPSLQLQRLVKAAWEVRRAALAGGARAAQENH
jgi:hypothetical protein